MSDFEYELMCGILELPIPPEHHTKKRKEQRENMEMLHDIIHAKGMRGARLVDANRNSVKNRLTDTVNSLHCN